MTYQLALDHDNEIELEEVNPQPRSNGIFQGGEEIYAGDGCVYEDGVLYTEWIYSFMEEDEYVQFLTDADLLNNKSRKITIKTVQTPARTFANYNGEIIRPRNVEYKYWYKDVVFRIKDLVAL